MDDIIIRTLAIIGGTGVIGGLIVAIVKFAGNFLRDTFKEEHRKETEGELEGIRQRYALRRVQADKFAETQFDKYRELWESLQSLKLAVDALWCKATKPNLFRFGQQLRKTKQKVGDWSIFFKEPHRNELRATLQALEYFEAGKERLVEIRSMESYILIKTRLKIRSYRTASTNSVLKFA